MPGSALVDQRGLQWVKKVCVCVCVFITLASCSLKVFVLSIWATASNAAVKGNMNCSNWSSSSPAHTQSCNSYHSTKPTNYRTTEHIGVQISVCESFLSPHTANIVVHCGLTKLHESSEVQQMNKRQELSFTATSTWTLPAHGWLSHSNTTANLKSLTLIHQNQFLRRSDTL